MAKNIEKLAEHLGAEVVAELPETGGGAFGAARLAKFVVWSDEITAERPGGPPTEEDADRQEAAARTKQ